MRRFRSCLVILCLALAPASTIAAPITVALSGAWSDVTTLDTHLATHGVAVGTAFDGSLSWDAEFLAPVFDGSSIHAQTSGGPYPFALTTGDLAYAGVQSRVYLHDNWFAVEINAPHVNDATFIEVASVLFTRTSEVGVTLADLLTFEPSQWVAAVTIINTAPFHPYYRMDGVASEVTTVPEPSTLLLLGGGLLLSARRLRRRSRPAESLGAADPA